MRPLTLSTPRGTMVFWRNTGKFAGFVGSRKLPTRSNEIGAEVRPAGCSFYSVFRMDDLGQAHIEHDDEP